jgi:hypothetical protein
LSAQAWAVFLGMRLTEALTPCQHVDTSSLCIYRQRSAINGRKKITWLPFALQRKDAYFHTMWRRFLCCIVRRYIALELDISRNSLVAAL